MVVNQMLSEHFESGSFSFWDVECKIENFFLIRF